MGKATGWPAVQRGGGRSQLCGEEMGKPVSPGTEGSQGEEGLGGAGQEGP